MSAALTAAAAAAWEMCIGATRADIEGLLRFYSAFGFEETERGSLSRPGSRELYGVDSELRSMRLRNASGYGLVRIMEWRRPTGPGLGLAGLKTLGNRWTTLRTDDLLAVANHAEDAAREGHPLYYVPPRRNLSSRGSAARPFLDPAPCIHELVLVQPLTRHVLFQRHEYRGSGGIDEQSRFRTSGLMHFALVVENTPEARAFYERALGWRVEVPEKEQADSGNRELYALAEGETLYATVLVPSTPRAGARAHLHLLSFRGGPIATSLEVARPGALGVCLYTQRCHDPEAARTAVLAAGAKSLTPIVENELGEPSFVFTAPDGYAWAVLGSPGTD